MKLCNINVHGEKYLWTVEFIFSILDEISSFLKNPKFLSTEQQLWYNEALGISKVRCENNSYYTNTTMSVFDKSRSSDQYISSRSTEDKPTILSQVNSDVGSKHMMRPILFKHLCFRQNTLKYFQPVLVLFWLKTLHWRHLSRLWCPRLIFPTTCCYRRNLLDVISFRTVEFIFKYHHLLKLHVSWSQKTNTSLIQRCI